jgi:hypothetical protein
MSPAKAEKAAQLVPNWNSIGMPVITPMTKVMAKILPQNRAATLWISSPLRRYSVFNTTRRSASPMVSWGKR